MTRRAGRRSNTSLARLVINCRRQPEATEVEFDDMLCQMQCTVPRDAQSSPITTAIPWRNWVTKPRGKSLRTIRG